MSQPAVESNSYELGAEGLYAEEVLAGQVSISLKGCGTWPFMVKYGRGGFSTWYSWTVDPSLLKGFPVFRLQSCPGPLVMQG